MTREFAIIAAGTMGGAVAHRLTEKGGRVLTLLDGRSSSTRRRAEDSGMIAVDEDRIARADIVFSIVPPAEALALAERLVPALTRSPRKPIFVDCNAISAQTVKQVAAIIAPTGARFVDGAIIGGPPKPGEPGPTFYFSGGPAADLEGLRDYELTTRTIASQIGAASALKMSYAGITKGLAAIAAAMVLAATRAGAAPALREERANPSCFSVSPRRCRTCIRRPIDGSPKCARSRSLPRKMLPLAECTTHLRIYTSDWPLITDRSLERWSRQRRGAATAEEGRYTADL